MKKDLNTKIYNSINELTGNDIERINYILSKGYILKDALLIYSDALTQYEFDLKDENPNANIYYEIDTVICDFDYMNERSK